MTVSVSPNLMPLALIRLALIVGLVLGMPLAGWAQALPKEFSKAAAKVTVLEFSAPWCLSCKKLKPEVDKLQKEMGNKLVVHHLNVEKPETERYINLYKIDTAPSFIVYNGQGKLVQRVDKEITPEELRQLIKKAMQ